MNFHKVMRPCHEKRIQILGLMEQNTWYCQFILRPYVEP